MKRFGFLVIAFAALQFHSVAAGEAVHPNDCGTNLSQVKQIILSRHPHIGSNYTDKFVGRWTYPGISPVVLSENRPFLIMGYEILVCPRANKSFVVLWKREKTKAGVLTMKSRNVITISQTSMGTLELKRDGGQVIRTTQ